MKTTFSLFLILSLAFSIIGCEAQNPVCTDNFCFVGEAFPRSELDTSQPFSEVDIDDSRILATFIGSPVPVETTPVDDIPVDTTATLSDILADTGAGGRTYLNKTVTVTGYVVFENTTRDAIVINTQNSLRSTFNAFFWIEDFGNPTTFDDYQLNEIYTFTVTTYLIRTPGGEQSFYSIWSRFPE